MRKNTGLITLYSLTFWAAFLELSIILHWFTIGIPVIVIGFGMAIFQSSYLIRDFLFYIRIKPVIVKELFVISSIIVGIILFINSNIFILELFTILILITTIRYLRAWGKTVESINPKCNGLFRLFGYAIGGVIIEEWVPIIIFGIVISILLVMSQWPNPKISVLPKEPIKSELLPILSFELFHSLHYFVYCYFLLQIFWNLLASERWTIGLLFMLGWVGYDVFYSKLKNYSPIIIIIGHIINAIVLIHLGFSDRLVWLIVLWIITGFGGGTNFSIRYCIPGDYHSLAEYRELIENVGHVLGPIIGAILFYNFGNMGVFITAAVFALAASASIVLNIYQKNNRETQKMISF